LRVGDAIVRVQAALRRPALARDAPADREEPSRNTAGRSEATKRT
jgi:hypothetical protein